jgi:hypothetical protein
MQTIKIKKMENNRRSFFKGLATFASGVAAAKVATYIPKKEEKKETVFVPSTLIIMHEGKEFHPLVVEKTDKDKILYAPYSGSLGIGSSPSSLLDINGTKPTIRKANI